MKNALILISEVPVPNETKIKLMNLLSKEEYNNLHRSFLEDMFGIFKSFKNELDIFIAYTPDSEVDLIKGLIPDYVQLLPQYGKSLKDNLKNSMITLISDYEKVVLVGANVPQIQEDTIKEAFNLLDENNICIGPTSHSGYYLIGMKDKIYDCIFDNINFEEKELYKNTIDQCNINYLKVGICDKYTDVYTIEDVSEFIKEVTCKECGYSKSPINTLDFIEKHIIDKIAAD